MVKPSQPKGIKPKMEVPELSTAVEQESTWTGQKLIAVNTLITVIICTLFIGGNYFIVNSVVDSKLSYYMSEISNEEEHEVEEGARQRGIILDLGEFILNLSDPSAKRYLKVNVALELTRAEHDPDLSGHSESSGGHGEKAEPVDPLKVIEAEMNQYKPAIRDSIISVLSSKTAEELSSLAGKELSKEQIKEAIDPVFAGEREVIRVSFGTFIIQ